MVFFNYTTIPEGLIYRLPFTIFSRALMASLRTFGFLFFTSFLSCDTAVLASGPISPRARAAATQTSTSLSFKASMRAGTALRPILPRPLTANVRDDTILILQGLGEAGQALWPDSVESQCGFATNSLCLIV